MYQKVAIKVPEIRGKIFTKSKGSSTYVLYQYGSEYKKEKQYAVPKRAIVGKLIPDNPGMMYPNDSFREYFPDVDIPEELPYAYRSCALKIGAYVIIKHVIDEYGLRPMITKRLGDDAGLFFDLVAYLIVDEENAGQYYPDFAFDHPLFSDQMKIYSDSKVSRLLNSITKEQCIGFLDDWNKHRDHNNRVYISYDSTNKNCQAGDIELVEFGKAKDDRHLPVFNLSIAMDQTNTIPLLYEEYPGSVVDISQFTFMVDKVLDYGYKNIGFILDRGYFSKENINELDDNGYSFIMMVKGCKSLVSSLIIDKRNTFETKRNCCIRAYKVYGTTVPSHLYEDDTKDRYFHIFYNPGKQAAEREKLEQKVEKLKEHAEKFIGSNTKFGKTYHDYFHLHYNKKGILVGVDEREDVIDRELQLCGYFCIITSDKMTASEALIKYKGRDISEKLFRADKSFIGSKSERIQSSESLSAKIFVEFIALIVRNRIYNLLKENMLRLNLKHNYMTVPAALRELEKIEMVRRNDRSYKLDHAVTKTQKTILSSFGLDEKDIRKSANEISRLLADGQSLMDTEVPEDGEEENNSID